MDAVAAAALAARQLAGTRTGRRRARGARGRRGSSGGTDANRPRGGYSGARPDDTDPQPVGRLLAGYVAERGWERSLAEARVFAQWAELVGPDVAGHCEPVSLVDGELRLAAHSTAWATQLRLLQQQVLARLRAELGEQVVRRITITGPVGPSWKRGPLSVRGRGPRDTYG